MCAKYSNPPLPLSLSPVSFHSISSSLSGAKTFPEPGTFLGLKVASKHLLNMKFFLFAGGVPSKQSPSGGLRSRELSRVRWMGGGISMGMVDKLGLRVRVAVGRVVETGVSL